MAGFLGQLASYLGKDALEKRSGQMTWALKSLDKMTRRLEAPTNAYGLSF